MQITYLSKTKALRCLRSFQLITGTASVRSDAIDLHTPKEPIPIHGYILPLSHLFSDAVEKLLMYIRSPGVHLQAMSYLLSFSYLSCISFNVISFVLIFDAALELVRSLSAGGVM